VANVELYDLEGGGLPVTHEVARQVSKWLMNRGILTGFCW